MNISSSQSQMEHVEPKEETFSIPLRYIDVIRRTHTTLDVLQESRKDDYWNVDVVEICRNHWRFHAVRNVKCQTSWRICVVRGAAYKHSSNHKTWSSVTRNLVLNVTNSSTKYKARMGYRETQDAGKLRGIYFIDPDRVQRNRWKRSNVSSDPLYAEDVLVQGNLWRIQRPKISMHAS